MSLSSRTAVLIVLATAGTSAAAQTEQSNRNFSSTESLFEHVNDSVCTISAVGQDGKLTQRGSGFILKDSGLLVTNAHVLDGLREATVKCGNTYTSIDTITKYAPDIDLVLVETGDLDVEGLALSGGEETKPGTQVYVIGSPFGLEGTISPGLASGHREIDGQTYLQISAPISAGSSGGPVVDEHGSVLGVTVASLEVAQGINFALPASVIGELPDIRMQLTDLEPQSSRAQPRQPGEPPASSGVFVASEAGEFRGFPFGTPCGEIAIAEYQRRTPATGAGGSIRFPKWYSGRLEFDVSLYGAPVRLTYQCDERHGMVQGRYAVSGNEDAVERISDILSRRYGRGTQDPISEKEASQLGCRWNFSLPGSRNYRPSERTSWEVDERFRVDMLVCGGDSDSTFVTWQDPALVGGVLKSTEPGDL